MAALYYQSATKEPHGKDKAAAGKEEPIKAAIGANAAGNRVSLSGVGAANGSSTVDPRDEETAAVQPLLAQQQR